MAVVVSASEGQVQVLEFRSNQTTYIDSLQEVLTLNNLHKKKLTIL